MKISEMITDRYKLRIPPTVYYDLLADVVEAEDDQDPFKPEELVKKNINTAVWSTADKDDITQWKWHDTQTCSKCGMGGKHYDEFKYCPNCGKIMTNAKGWGRRWE